MWQLVITLFILAVVQEILSHPVLTPFRKVDKDGNVIDRRVDEHALKKRFVDHILHRDNTAKLKLWPEVATNGGTVIVTWTGVKRPKQKDFIAFYCPHDSDSRHHMDYFHVSESKSWEKGYGHHSVVVFNMRSTCIFKYYRDHPSHSQLVATSKILTFDNGDIYAPLQRHIAVTGDPTKMRIMWNSAKVKSQAVVKYGLTKQLGLTETDVNGYHYNADDMCEGPANSTGFWDPGYTYIATLTNLKPNTRYYYSVGSQEMMSDTLSFLTAIEPGSQDPFKFIIYGDMGVTPFPQAHSTAEHVNNEVTNNNIRFVLHHGDISYSQGYAYIWDQWYDLVQPYAQQVPYMVSIGNHEYDYMTGRAKDPSHAEGEGGFRPDWFPGENDSGGECGVPMYNRFHMPDTGNSLWWYSFNYGMVHVIMMSTEHNYTRGSPLYQWLENDLKNVDRSVTPWVILAGHRAMYASANYTADYKVAVNMQLAFEDLLFQYKVDVAFWAHYHSYERTCLMYKNECRDDGVLHILVGSAGRHTDRADWLGKKWSMFRMNDYGYGRVTVANQTHLLYEWINNRANEPFDWVWLKK